MLTETTFKPYEHLVHNNPHEVARFFTRSDGTYWFSRWGRPIAPVVFGVEDHTILTVKKAIQSLCDITNHVMSETDPELGVNLMMFFVRDWDELLEVPSLDQLIVDFAALVARLKQSEANQYRFFRFDDHGAIRACFVFLRMDEALSALPADTIALLQAVHSMLLWSDDAFQDNTALVETDAGLGLRSQIATLLRVSYDPVLPAMSRDPSHALRLSARMQLDH